MKISNWIVFVVLMVGFIPHASAQSEATLEAEAWFRKADGEMNQVYKAVMAKLHDGREKAEFVKAQKAWLAFRDADAKFRARVTSGGGSAYSMDYLGNLAELTEARTKELGEFLKYLPRPVR